MLFALQIRAANIGRMTGLAILQEKVVRR